MLTQITSTHGDPQAGAPLLVLLHGRGSNEKDLQGLTELLSPGTTLVTPRAPHEAGAWGYGPGWAWYRYLEEDRVEPETLDSSLQALDRFLETLPDELPEEPGALVLGGFSQGGTTALAWALSRPGRVAGVANFSGFLVDHPRVALDEAGRLPVFWGHGQADGNIPFDLARRGRGQLREAGADLREFDHPGGHNVTPDEVRAFRSWIDELGAPGASA